MQICAPADLERGVLQVMRHDVSLALGKTGPNVDVMCTDKRFGGRFLTFAQVRLPAFACMLLHHFALSLPHCNSFDALLRFSVQ